MKKLTYDQFVQLLKDRNINLSGGNAVIPAKLIFNHYIIDFLKAHPEENRDLTVYKGEDSFLKYCKVKSRNVSSSKYSEITIDKQTLFTLSKFNDGNAFLVNVFSDGNLLIWNVNDYSRIETDVRPVSTTYRQSLYVNKEQVYYHVKDAKRIKYSIYIDNGNVSFKYDDPSIKQDEMNTVTLF